MYKCKDIVKYSEINRDGYLPLYGILEYFQNCINFHSLDIGMDYESMMKKNKAWVLISWKIKLLKKINLYDKVEIGTWAYDFDKMYGYRNYVILDENGEKAACAETKWVLIDLKTRMPLRVEVEDTIGYATGEKLDMPPMSRKLKLSDDVTKYEPVKVLSTYIDTNGHMNNTAYFRLAEEYLPGDFEYDTVDAVYVKETTEGMTMIPCVHKEENGIGISFESEEGKTYTKIKYYKEEK